MPAESLGPCLLCGRAESMLWYCQGVCSYCGDSLQANKLALVQKYGAALRKLALAREALKAAEYAADVLEDGRYVEVCPLCRYGKESGHSGGCTLAAALAATEGE